MHYWVGTKTFIFKICCLPMIWCSRIIRQALPGSLMGTSLRTSEQSGSSHLDFLPFFLPSLCCHLAILLLSPGPSPFSLAALPTNKFLAQWILSWHLLLGGSRITQVGSGVVWENRQFDGDVEPGSTPPSRPTACPSRWQTGHWEPLV